MKCYLGKLSRVLHRSQLFWSVVLNSRSVRVLPQAICTNDIGANSSQSMIFTVERQRTLNKREGWTGRVSVHTPDWRRFVVFFVSSASFPRPVFFAEHFSSALFGCIFSLALFNTLLPGPPLFHCTFPGHWAFEKSELARCHGYYDSSLLKL